MLDDPTYVVVRVRIFQNKTMAAKRLHFGSKAYCLRLAEGMTQSSRDRVFVIPEETWEQSTIKGMAS